MSKITLNNIYDKLPLTKNHKECKDRHKKKVDFHLISMDNFQTQSLFLLAKFDTIPSSFLKYWISLTFQHMLLFSVYLPDHSVESLCWFILIFLTIQRWTFHSPLTQYFLHRWSHLSLWLQTSLYWKLSDFYFLCRFFL